MAVGWDSWELRKVRGWAPGSEGGRGRAWTPEAKVGEGCRLEVLRLKEDEARVLSSRCE